MAKSRKAHRKLKLVRSTAHPSPRAVLKPRAVVRSARRRTRPPVVESGVPLRTLARTQVLASAESLGVTLSKPQLRKAIDRTVKLFKQRVEDGDAKIGVRGTVDAPPSLAALGHVETYAGIDRHPYLGHETVVGPLEQRGRDHAAIDRGALLAQQPLLQPPSQPSPWSSVYSALDESVQMLGERVRQLTSKLTPVLLPAPGGPNGTDPGVSSNSTPHVLEGIELQRARIDNVRAALAALFDRIVV